MSSIDTVLSVQPADDAGAQTADRYEWQAAMAAADGLAAYAQHHNGNLQHLNPSMVRIICEYHEDWIIQIDTEAELVSAKHREQSRGPWKSITDLVSAGGIGHLFVRWLLVNRQASARIVTNLPTATGEATEFTKCRALLEKLSADGKIVPDEQVLLDRCLNTFCKALMMYRKDLPPQWRAPEGTRSQDQKVPEDLQHAARAFILILRFDQNRPMRELTRHAAPSLYVSPLLGMLGKSNVAAESVWEAIIQLFRLRMRAQGPTADGALPSVGPLPQAQKLDRVIESRVITLQDIMITVKTALAHPEAYKPITSLRRVTKLGMKMSQGGCSNTSIERAEQLKIDYSNYRRERRNHVPGSAPELQLIERILHRIADEETHKARKTMGLWGGDLWAALSARLQSGPEELAKFELEGDLGLGGISELTSRCKVWYSDYFDVDAAISTLKQQRAGTK